MTDICLLGEAWGVDEEKTRTPFTGAAGYELTKMLDEAGISRADCFLTNVFNLHPAGNKIEALCGPKSDSISGYPALTKGRHVRSEFICELERLGDELTSINPNIVIALGNTAMWALLGKTAISKFRGTTELSTHTATGFKTLPTYHPSYILRGSWDQRPIAILDLMKAKRESEFPEIRRPKREIWIEPTLEDLYEFERRYIRDYLSVDIENPGGPIDCIGFAPAKDIGIVIPFIDKRKKSRSYWRSKEEEIEALKFVKRNLEEKRIKKVMQNGLYDVAVIWRFWGFKVFGFDEDSMLLHHALQPESLKGLAFLGSIYTDEGPWKHMRSKWKSFKRDD